MMMKRVPVTLAALALAAPAWAAEAEHEAPSLFAGDSATPSGRC